MRRYDLKPLLPVDRDSTNWVRKCSAWPGIGVRLGVERVFAMLWNGCSTSRGIGVRHAVCSAP